MVFSVHRRCRRSQALPWSTATESSSMAMITVDACA
jgi:hypothetical protein